MVGLAAGYATAASQRNALQQVIDSAAITLARDPDIDKLAPGDLNARATTYINGVSSTIPVNDLVVQAKITGGDVRLDASGNVPIKFGGLLGADSLAVKSSVTVSRAVSRSLEIALALDNTGSMNQNNKINELKGAVKAMVTYLSDPAKNLSPTKIAMVPFARNVRAPKSLIPDTLLAQPAPKDWDGCLTDRDEPYNTSDVAPISGVDASKFHWGSMQVTRRKTSYVAADCGSLAEIMPLTSQLSSISSAADALIADGNTNVTIGVTWGMHALMPGQPLAQGSPEGTQDLLRALIVLTDGDNTQDRFGYNNDGEIDARTLKACAAAKAKGILVYTIRLIDGNDNLLRSCASAAENYFYISDPSQLTPLFKQISGQLSKLRIAR